MLDAFAMTPVVGMERRLQKVEEAIIRQRGWNPVRDMELPALEAETARLRKGLAELRATWRVAPERRVIAICGSVFGVLAIVAAVLGFWGLVPALAGVTIGFVVIRGSMEVKKLLAPLMESLGALEEKTFVTVEVAQPASA